MVRQGDARESWP